jgi:hypothetical protein
VAWYDDFDLGEQWFGEPGPPPDVNELLFGGPGIEDARAQELFSEAFFNDNSQAYIDLIDYMYDTYGIDFEEAFEWEDFREWYSQQ